MSYSENQLLVSTLNEIDYLCRTYCKENSYLTLTDLKNRHKEYVFSIISMLRRCLETQTLNINRPGVNVFILCTHILQEAIAYYQSLSDMQDAETLKKACESFKEKYEAFIREMDKIKPSIPYGELDKDIRMSSLADMSWRYFGQNMQPHFTVKGHHANIYMPYPQTDINYMENCGYMLATLFDEEQRQFYSFRTEDMPETLFRNGKCLNTTKNRVNVKTRTFDAVIASRMSLFDDIRPNLIPAASYVKRGGSVIIYGLTSDFTKLDLKRIATALKDIHIFFYTYLPTAMPPDYEFCLITGIVRERDEMMTDYRELLDKFVNFTKDDTVVEILGSAEDIVVPFSSYDITEEEVAQLLPAVRKSTQKLIGTLIPKIKADTRQPLLPFSSGQLGLILISGEINGTIQELDTGCCHVVKGSSKQQTDTNTETTTDETTGRTHYKTTTNTYASTNVNIILPNGQMRTLY